MFEPRNWRLEDPCPGLPLANINPPSSRAWAALIRSRDKDVVRRSFLGIVGAIDMMRGLEYHSGNFCRIINEIALLSLLDAVSLEKKLTLIHEGVAYLNRLGQFYYFASSRLVRGIVSDWNSIIPMIVKLKRFRDKHSAHRSIDKPKPGDKAHVQEVHAWVFSSLGGGLFSPKPGKARVWSPSDFMNQYKMWTESYFCFQLIGDGEHDTLNLCIERDHPVIISEAYELISAVLQTPRGCESGE